MRLLTDILKDLTEKDVSDDPAVNMSVFFYAGTYQEVTNELTERSQTPSHKNHRYPLIWLVLPFDERMGARGNGVVDAENLRLIIAMQTLRELDSMQRLDSNFKGTLIPIYEALMRAISMSPEIDTPGPLSIPHKRRLWPYWGAPEAGVRGANIFNDMVDVIEISGLNLVINTQIC